MRNFKLTATLFLLTYGLSAQSELFEKMKREITYYKSLPNYVVIPITHTSPDYLNPIKIEFNDFDSLILVIPVESTYGFASLFRETEHGLERLNQQDGNALSFIRFVIYRSEYYRYQIEFNDCFSQNFVRLKMGNEKETN